MNASQKTRLRYLPNASPPLSSSPSRNLILQIIRPPIMTWFLHALPLTPPTPIITFTLSSTALRSGLLASRLPSPENLVLQLICKTIVGGGVVLVDVSFTTTAGVEGREGFAPEGGFGDYVGVVGGFLGGAEAGGADVGGAAAAGGEGSVTLVSYEALADDFAVGVGGIVSGNVCRASSTMGNEWFVGHVVVVVL